MHEPKPLSTLLAELCEIPTDDFDSPRLMPLLQDSILRPRDIEPYLHWKKGGYSRNLVHRDDVFEMLVVCWGVGQESAIHNHSGEEGWVLVQEGALEVTNYRLLTCDKTRNGRQPTPCPSGCHSVLEEVSREVVRAGEATAEVGDEVHIHKIANPLTHGKRAVSIHIYSRPLDSCVVYDLEGESCRRVQLSYDTGERHDLQVH